MHYHGIVHGNLKLSNIISVKNVLKLTDFLHGPYDNSNPLAP